MMHIMHNAHIHVRLHDCMHTVVAGQSRQRSKRERQTRIMDFCAAIVRLCMALRQRSNMISPSTFYQRLPIHVTDSETNDSSEEVDFPPHFQLELKESVVLQESVNTALDDLFIDSQLFSHTKSKSLTVMETPSRVGSKLGQGGFCHVHEYMEDVDRKTIKFLSCTTLEDPQQRTIGTVDLVRARSTLSISADTAPQPPYSYSWRGLSRDSGALLCGPGSRRKHLGQSDKDCCICDGY